MYKFGSMADKAECSYVNKCEVGLVVIVASLVSTFLEGVPGSREN